MPLLPFSHHRLLYCFQSGSTLHFTPSPHALSYNWGPPSSFSLRSLVTYLSPCPSPCCPSRLCGILWTPNCLWISSCLLSPWPICSCDWSVSLAYLIFPRHWLNVLILPGEASWQAVLEVQDYSAEGSTRMASEGKGQWMSFQRKTLATWKYECRKQRRLMSQATLPGF